MEYKQGRTFEDIMRSLIADEFLAYMQYQFGSVVATGKSLNFLDKIFGENRVDELDDHFNKLVGIAQSMGIKIETDFIKMMEICSTKYISFPDPTKTDVLVDTLINAEMDAIEAYVGAMNDPALEPYPDVKVALGEICTDERRHLKDLDDVQSAINGSDSIRQLKGDMNRSVTPEKNAEAVAAASDGAPEMSDEEAGSPSDSPVVFDGMDASDLTDASNGSAESGAMPVVAPASRGRSIFDMFRSFEKYPVASRRDFGYEISRGVNFAEDPKEKLDEIVEGEKEKDSSIVEKERGVSPDDAFVILEGKDGAKLVEIGEDGVHTASYDTVDEARDRMSDKDMMFSFSKRIAGILDSFGG